MKEFLASVLVLVVAGSSVAAQKVEQTGAAGTQKPAATQTAPQVVDCGCEDKPLPEVLAWLTE